MLSQPLRLTYRNADAPHNEPRGAVAQDWVSEQFPGHHKHRRYWTNFMGRETAFYYGIAQLAVLNKSPVFFCQVIRKGRGRFEVFLKKIADAPASEAESLQILDKYAYETERV